MTQPKLFCYVKCAIAFCLIFVSGDMYSSVLELEKLINTQESVIRSLETHIPQVTEKAGELRRFLETFKNEHKKAVTNIQKYIGNPINSFLLIKRLTSDLDDLKNIVSGFDPDPTLPYPSAEDLHGAGASIARLQETYKLATKDLAAGIIRGSFSLNRKDHLEMFTPMTANDCYMLSGVLYNVKNFEASREWLLEAYDKTTKEQLHKKMLVKVIKALVFVYISLDDIKNAEKWAKKLYELVSYDEHVTEALKEQRALDEKKDWFHYMAKWRKVVDKYPDATIRHQSLCRGEMRLPTEIERRLKCHYLMDKPFLKLAPLKMEQLYINPDIYMFHDMISDSEIEKVKAKGAPRLRRAIAESSTKEEVSRLRVSLSGWMTVDDDPVVGRIYSRVEDMTGLTTRSAEQVQLALYGPGGHFNTHHDYIPNDPSGMGYMIATVMFYFSDVDQGGATVFDYLGLTVFPVKGAALYWHNTHSSGEYHRNTVHGACPVLLGYKWAANVWIHAYGQEFSHPCEIGGDKKDETLIPAIWKPRKSSVDSV